MASRFVGGGTIGAESAAETDKQQSQPPAAAAGSKSVEWEVVQRQLEEERRRKDEARIKAATGGERSLYEILQANKAAKQEAFEEQHRLRNQFRALDDDEAAFLDEVRERQAQKENALRQETEQGLREFREKQRQGASGGALEENEASEDWGVSRKRKRAVRTTGANKVTRRSGEKTVDKQEAVDKGRETTRSQTTGKETSRVSALVAYGSDDSDDA
ncbi:hypothetical protein CDD82_3556 [Ophiocordyceps australis]|uniref:FAM192A/Fyv6 N-terminal domain-containing protein n=1 Tax=Ophiocordyceps australis TaxID=1399860 RepID=A0A2C5ZC99_9HYPO|nr:hypothetical protein CDD82_3556 [Ophiocordyceps australis]